MDMLLTLQILLLFPCVCVCVCVSLFAHSCTLKTEPYADQRERHRSTSGLARRNAFVPCHCLSADVEVLMTAFYLNKRRHESPRVTFTWHARIVYAV